MDRRTILVVAVVLMSCIGCDNGAAPPALSAPPPISMNECVWQPHGDGLDCLPQTMDGCICGQPDPQTGGPTGSCHFGACCTGCWDSGDPTAGIAPKCWPGDGTGGLYGDHGATCHSQR